MAKVPSLIDLCSDVLAEQLLCPFDDLLRSIYLLPSHLLHALIQRLPPMALRTLHHYLNRMLNDEDISGDDSTIERKRTGDWNLNLAWERLFRLRWPENIGQIQPTDWQQLYWESHVQNCLDEAAEIALIPMFSGCIADIQISGSDLVPLVASSNWFPSISQGNGAVFCPA
ncbi:unnamed protein product [Sphenostylis stenocarpa]|uniref:Uncharacterized protein n=1 Tax=Sphenostylis stenocarpa TaxID=92480 RepID=A0AA86RY17_9FABA|nr:unnamed protein product [Sphenostylis stenocarpa]